MKNTIFLFFILLESCGCLKAQSKDTLYFDKSGILTLVALDGQKDSIMRSYIRNHEIIDFILDKDTLIYISECLVYVDYCVEVRHSNRWNIIKREQIEGIPPESSTIPVGGYKPRIPIEYRLNGKYEVVCTSPDKTWKIDVSNASEFKATTIFPPEVVKKRLEKYRKKVKRRKRKEALRRFFSFKSSKNEIDI